MTTDDRRQTTPADSPSSRPSAVGVVRERSEQSERSAVLNGELQKVASHWDAQHTGNRRVQWWDLPPVTSYMNRMLSGDPQIGFAEYCVREILGDRAPVDHCLSLGCGVGHLERTLAAMGAFKVCDACDVAPKSLDVARKHAAEMGYHGINYFQADLNSIEPAPQRYDVVFAHAILHHIEDLEHLCEAVGAALKPEGLFLIHEYVGPSRFQSGQRQREIVNSVLRLLPPAYRQPWLGTEGAGPRPRYTPRRLAAKMRSGRLLEVLRTRLSWTMSRARGTPMALQSVRFATPADVTAVDPSEAVRSSEILEIVSRWFKIIDRRPLGGTLIQPLFSGDIAWNFIEAEYAQALLQMIVTIEETLLACGEIDSDYVFAVARPLPADADAS